MTVHGWWILVIFILAGLSSIVGISFDFLDKMGTLTHYLLIVIIIVLFFILSHVEKIYLLLKNTEENAEHKRMRDVRLERTSTEDLYTPSEENAEHKRMRDVRLERTSTEDLYTPSEASVSDILTDEEMEETDREITEKKPDEFNAFKIVLTIIVGIVAIIIFISFFTK